MERVAADAARARAPFAVRRQRRAWASGDTSVYTLGGSADFTSGTSTFSGAIDLGTGTSARGLTLAANVSGLVVLSGAATGTLGTGTAQANKLVKAVSDALKERGMWHEFVGAQIIWYANPLKRARKPQEFDGVFDKLLDKLRELEEKPEKVLGARG